jgi:hypothetical protein
MDITPISAILDLGGKILDKFIPDPAQRDAAKLALYQAQASGELDSLKIQLSAIIAEANSTDPWTSRARPSFMYVIYVMLLAGIPMGLVSAYSPDIALHIATGFKSWLQAIPDSLYTLFGVGYVGYATARTVDKVKGVA